MTRLISLDINSNKYTKYYILLIIAINYSKNQNSFYFKNEGNNTYQKNEITLDVDALVTSPYLITKPIITIKSEKK